MSQKTLETLDRVDWQILQALQANGRLTTAELAEKVSLSQSPCWRRVQILEESGFIDGYHAQLNRRMLGLGVHGFVTLRVRDSSLSTSSAFEREVRALPAAISCQNLSGGYDYQIELVAKDHETFSKIVREIRAFPGVSELYTSFTLQEIKSRGSLPLG